MIGCIRCHRPTDANGNCYVCDRPKPPTQKPQAMTTPSPAAEAFVNSLPLGIALYRREIMTAFDLALAEAQRDTARLAVWEYTPYRAKLTRNGELFALVTPDGRNALNERDTKILLDALNSRANADAAMQQGTAQKEP